MVPSSLEVAGDGKRRGQRPCFGSRRRRRLRNWEPSVVVGEVDHRRGLEASGVVVEVIRVERSGGGRWSASLEAFDGGSRLKKRAVQMRR